MSRTIASGLILGVALLAANQQPLLADAKAPLARERVNHPGPLIIAHRGDSKVAPENTLPAFVSAVQAGADLVELDYLHSADGVPVVFHDGAIIWRGTLDLLVHFASGLHVVEFKTGRPQPAHEAQLRLYVAAMEAIGGQVPVTGEVFYLGASAEA